MKTHALSSWLLMFVFLFTFRLPVAAREGIPDSGKQDMISGFEKEIDGEIITYYSASPHFAKDALLTRCTDGKKTIRWRTADVPVLPGRDYYYFYMLAGHSSGTSGADRKFTLQVNGVNCLTFTTTAKRKPPLTWSFTGKDSVSVVFSASKTDVHNDLFGSMVLRVPKKLVEPGKPLTLAITGNAENSNDWFMIFRYRYSEKLQFTSTPFLVQTEDGIKQILQLYVDHVFGQEKSMTLSVGNKTITIPLSPGFNEVNVPIDTVAVAKNLAVSATMGKKYSSRVNVIQHPVSRREVDIIHHSHNDIGYSHVQAEVMKIQYNNILDALDMVEHTADYPSGSRFVWNEETLWPVEYFLRHAGERDKARFIKAVMEGRIALSAYYAGVMTGLCSPEELRWISEYADTLKKRYGFPVTTAMLSDIPGMSWSCTDALAGSGIRYLSVGPNYIPEFPDKGERIGSIYRYLGDKPFYWKSTTGTDKVLVWMAGCGYSAFHQIPSPELGNKIKEKLASYLGELDSAGYPYDKIQLRYTIKSDNGPVDTGLSNFVRNWNHKYVSPKLVIANVGEMMQQFENKYGDRLPVLQGDFTPYWEDGAYSTAAEEGENRILSDRVQQLQQLAEMMPSKKPDPGWFYEARKNVIMFHEHTWGAWNSISAPDDPFAVNQWNYKKAFIDSARRYTGKIEALLLPESKKPERLTVYNTSSWTRNGYVEVKVPQGFKGNALVDETGEITTVQFLENGNLCFIAMNIPAKGSKTFHPVTSVEPIPVPSGRFQYEIDSVAGIIKSLRYQDKERVSRAVFKGLDQALYIRGVDPADNLSPVAGSCSVSENGTVVKTLCSQTAADGTGKVTYLVSFFQGLPYLEFSCIIDKKPVRTKEAMHLVFPFSINHPVNRIGISDTFYIPGAGQIPGSNKDFFSVQRWLDISGASGGVTVCSPQGALFEFGSMTDERPLNKGSRRWRDRADPSSTLFLYALNNYWNTNFKADQQGLIRYDCYLLFHNAFDPDESKHFGETIHFPLIPVLE